MGHDVFVSYSNHDKLFVDALVNHLENNNFRCWYAPRDIPPGTTWPKAITQAIREIPVMVLVFSSSSNNSQEVSRELTLASNNKNIVIPVRIENVLPSAELEYHLSNRHWLDVYTLDTGAAISQVLEVLRSYENRTYERARQPASSTTSAGKPPAGPLDSAVHTGKFRSRPGSRSLPLKRLISLSLLLLVLAGGLLFYWTQTQEDQAALKPYPDAEVHVYSDRARLSVRTLQLQSVQGNQALVQINGLGNKYDGHIFLCTSFEKNDELRFKTMVDGTEKVIFSLTLDKGVVFNPVGGNHAFVSYHSSDKKPGSAQDLYNAYLARANEFDPQPSPAD